MPVRPTRSVHLVARMLRLGAVALCAACAMSSATAQVTTLKAPPARTLITARIDPQQRVALQGHVATWARVEHDRGAVPDDTSLTHLALALKRSPEREAAFQQLLKDQQ